MIHVPMWIKNKYTLINRAILKLRQTREREPTCEEVAAQIAIDTESKVCLWATSGAGPA